MRYANRWFGLIVAAIGLAWAGTSWAQDASALDQTTSAQVVPKQASVPHWLVELTIEPTITKQNSPETVASSQEQFLSRARAKFPGFKILRKFHGTLFNGFLIEATRATADRLARMPGVKAISEDGLLTLPEPWRASPVTASDVGEALGPLGEPPDDAWLRMTGADVAHDRLGLTGRGVKLAIIDSGIDFNHADLGGCFGLGCRVETGYDFVGDNYDPTRCSPPFTTDGCPVEGGEPHDVLGHGTHVSGIAAARSAGPSGVTGVAPFALIHIYRVFGKLSSDGQAHTAFSIVIAAMERAYEEGAQIVSMSLGSDNGNPNSMSAQAAERLALNGVAVVAAAGNAGAALGVYAVSDPSVAEHVVSAASFDSTPTSRLKKFSVDSGADEIGYDVSDGAPRPPASGSAQIVPTGTPTTDDDACNGIGVDVSGKIALIRRGTCTFNVKAVNAELAGAIGVIIYNNRPGIFNSTTVNVAGRPPVHIPTVTTTDGEGNSLYDRFVSQGQVALTWLGVNVFKEVVVDYGPDSKPGLLSTFSSFGPTSLDLNLKPDVSAPGGFIRSTYPLALGRYATINGTSMATPHTAGAIALLLEAFPDVPSTLVQTLLQNSAVPATWSLDSTSSSLDAVHRQGGGLINIPALIANVPHTLAFPGKLSLGETHGAPVGRTLTIENKTNATVTYTFGHVPALATTNRRSALTDADYRDAPASVSFSRPNVVVTPHSFGFVDITFVGPADTTAKLFGGYITVTPNNGDGALSVPYAGFNGTGRSPDPGAGG